LKLKIVILASLGFFITLNSFSENFSSWKKIDRYYKKNNIDIDNLHKDQISQMILLDSIPEDFGKLKEVQKKKKIFYLIAFPLIYKTNEDIKIERQLVIDIEKKYNRNKIEEDDRTKLISLATKYKLDYKQLNRTFFKRMKQRINIVPVSLAIGQAIIESGWGQSRFALQGNALYGQWTYDQQEGLIPEKRDPEKSHAVKKFDKLEDSVRSYMFNLNTHPAYLDFRIVRRITNLLQVGNSKIAVNHKMQQLAAYAEIRKEYVDKLEIIVDTNDLTRFDKIN
jgi:Bax protein